MQNATFEESIFPCLANESHNQSSFLFNPFEIIPIEDLDEPDLFDVYPNQERFIGEQQLDEIVGAPSRGPNEIIGDVSPENILSHH